MTHPSQRDAMGFEPEHLDPTRPAIAGMRRRQFRRPSACRSRLTSASCSTRREITGRPSHTPRSENVNDAAPTTAAGRSLPH